MSVFLYNWVDYLWWYLCPRMFPCCLCISDWNEIEKSNMEVDDLDSLQVLRHHYEGETFIWIGNIIISMAGFLWNCVGFGATKPTTSLIISDDDNNTGNTLFLEARFAWTLQLSDRIYLVICFLQFINICGVLKLILLYSKNIYYWYIYDKNYFLYFHRVLGLTIFFCLVG